MVALATYEELDFYDKRLDLSGQDFVLAFSKEFWFSELPLNAQVPTTTTVTVDNSATPVPVDSTSMNVVSDAPITIYRGDILKFTSALVVVSATTTLDGTATPAALPVVSTSAEIADAETALSYGLIPFWSLQDGGDIEFTGTEAIARNKIQGLYPAKRTTERDGTINLSGGLYVSDPGAILMEDLGDGSRNIYYEIRWAPYQVFTGAGGSTSTEGSGPGARTGVATIQSFTVAGARSEFATVNCTLGIASRPDPYFPLVA